MTPHPLISHLTIGGPAGPSRISGPWLRCWVGRVRKVMRVGLRFLRGPGGRSRNIRRLGDVFGSEGRDGSEKAACTRARISKGSGENHSYAKGKISSPSSPSSPKTSPKALIINNRRNENRCDFSSPVPEFQAHRTQIENARINRWCYEQNEQQDRV